MYIDGDFGISVSGWMEIIKILITSYYSSFHNDQNMYLKILSRITSQ